MLAATRRCRAPRLVRHFARPRSLMPPLPPVEDWKSHFPPTSRDARSRVFLHNQQTAASLAKKFLADTDLNSTTGRVVIEAYPGPGVLTRALLKYPSSVLRKLIVLEDMPMYLKYLKELESVDTRVVVLPVSGYEWSSYRRIQEEGLLEGIKAQPWNEGMNQNLQFISHLPQSAHGEQLIAQLLRYISERLWLYKYGRITMNMILAESVWQRISAPTKDRNRCKLGVIAEANADFELVATPTRLSPYVSHFFPPPPSHTNKARLSESKRLGQPFVAATFKPKAVSFITGSNLDKWDYVLRKLFVLKANPLKKALPALAPGANNLLPVLETDPAADLYVDTSKPVRSLELEEWRRVVQAFENWPFAPDMLFISDSLGVSHSNSTR